MTTRHKILNRHAFSAGEPDPSSAAQVLAEKMAAFFDQILADCKRQSARLAAIETLFRDPEVQAKAGMKAGIRSGRGTEESMKADNERLTKQLARPAFAAAFFVAQRHAFMARKRMSAGLPQRRLS